MTRFNRILDIVTILLEWGIALFFLVILFGGIGYLAYQLIYPEISRLL